MSPMERVYALEQERQAVNGVGGVEGWQGWQMPEGFIRLEGGREQFLWNSIRLKHKHRRASNPGLAPHSLSYGTAIFFSAPT